MSVGLASFTLIGASPLQAQAPDPRAADAVQFFTSFCLATGGSRDRAIAVLEDGNELATRLPYDVVKKAQADQEGGIGWAVRSPHDAVIMLDYDRQGICAVRIAEADESSVQDVVDALVRGVARGVSRDGAGELSSQPPQIRENDGIRTTYTSHSFPVGDRTAHIALTTAPEAVGAQQHLITFAFID